MAELKKYLDQTGLEALIGKIKSEDDAHLAEAKAYSDNKDKLFDAAGTGAQMLVDAKTYTDEKVAPLATTEALNTVDDKVDAEVKRATEKEAELLGLIEATDAIADKAAEDVAALAQTHATDKAALEAQDTELAEAIEAVDDKIGEVTEGQTVMGIIANIQENAYDDTELRNLISGLDTNKADKTQVATDIADAVKAEEDARKEAVAGVQGEVDALEQTHATDKAALEASIALKADQSALDEVASVANAAVKQSDYDTKVAALEAEDARIAGLVETEAAKAREEEGKLDTRLEKVEAFFELAEGEKLDEAKDTLIEIQKIIDSDAAVADQMLLDIAANKKAVEDHVATDHDFASADATLKAELEGKINAKADASVVEGIDGRVEVAEGKITTIEEKLANVEANADVNVIETVKVNGVALTPDADKAVDVIVPTGELASKDEVAESDLAEELATKINGKADQSALDEAVEALEGADETIKGRLDALEAIDHSHENAAVLDGITAEKVATWDTVSSKAAQTDLEALVTRVGTAEGEIDTLQEEMDAVEQLAAANKAAHEANAAAIALKASQSDLEAAVARIKVNEDNIALKANAEDLEDAVERIGVNETNIAANTAAIAAFSPIATTDIEGLFA